MPPETVKDSINQGIEVPIFYIIPEQRFDKKFGINVAEFEFPAYYNYFVRKRKINLICDKEAEKAIRIIFQETLLGPVSHEVMLRHGCPLIFLLRPTLLIANLPPTMQAQTLR